MCVVLCYKMYAMKILLLCMVTAAVKCEQVQEFQNSNLQFATDIYKEICKRRPENFLVCPLSVQIVLSLATVGAKENTAKELSNSLHLPDDSTKIQHIFQKLNKYFDVEHPYQFNSANKIYLGGKYHINKDYKEIATNTFKCDIENINFAESEKAAKQINQWVENKTSNKIKDLIKKESLKPETFAILVNALYFHGNWVHEFGNTGDYKEKFFVNENETEMVSVMTQRNDFNYYHNKKLNAQFLELPFVGNDVTMTIVLPQQKYGLKDIENHISSVLTPQPLQKLDSVITIPKFTMESTIEFKEVLEALGVREPFSQGANFKGMTDASVYIDEVVQKTFIEINEKGATAAAATELSVIPVSMPRVFFNANHPFIYFLRHSSTGVFFIGRFSRP